MTASNKKIEKILNKAYESILKIIMTDLSKKYKIPISDLEKILESEKDTEEKKDD